jgi:hypothetical protein
MKDNEVTASIVATPTEPSQPDKDWPSKCVGAALKTHPVPAKVSATLIEQLNGTARERALKNSELTALAQSLISALDELPEEETGA